MMPKRRRLSQHRTLSVRHVSSATVSTGVWQGEAELESASCLPLSWLSSTAASDVVVVVACVLSGEVSS